MTSSTVSTPDGDVPISEVEIGDTVYAYDELTGEVKEHTVVNTFVHDDDQIVYLTIDGEEIETTPWHPFYTDEGWEDAGNLQPGDLILSLNEDYGVVESIVIVDETQTMYDLDVETLGTFAVGDGAWVVHNCDEGDIGTYRDLNNARRRAQRRGTTVDLTPHHAPSNAFMQRQASDYGYSYDMPDGITIFMDPILHADTSTFRRRWTDTHPEAGLTPRQSLVYNVTELRQIYSIYGFFGSTYETMKKLSV